MISGFFKTYLIQFLMIVLLTLIATLGVFYFQKNALKNELKMKKDEVLELKTKIILLKKNSKTEIANAVNAVDVNKTIDEIKEIKREIFEINDHGNNSNILGGMFFMHPSN